MIQLQKISSTMKVLKFSAFFEMSAFASSASFAGWD